MYKDILEECYVEVEAVRPFYETPSQEVLRDTEDLRDEIKRHCDVRSATVVSKWLRVCEHCGSPWEDPENLPLCCTQLMQEFDTAMVLVSWLTGVEYVPENGEWA